MNFDDRFSSRFYFACERFHLLPNFLRVWLLFNFFWRNTAVFLPEVGLAPPCFVNGVFVNSIKELKMTKASLICFGVCGNSTDVGFSFKLVMICCSAVLNSASGFPVPVIFFPFASESHH